MLLVLTVYRLKMRKKYNEMKQLIRQAMVDLGSRNQPAYVSDFFDNYFKEHVLKMQSLMSDDLGQIEDDFLFDLSKLVLEFLNEFVLEHGKPEPCRSAPSIRWRASSTPAQVTDSVPKTWLFAACSVTCIRKIRPLRRLM